MAFAAVRVTVGTSPTRLDITPERDAQVGKSVLGSNRGDSAIYIGGPDVTTAQGFQVDAGQSFTTQHLQAESLWAVTDSGTCRVDVLQQGV